MKPLLYLPDGREYNPAAAPTTTVSEIGQVWDPFLTRSYDSEVTPELIGRSLAGSFPLARKHALAKRVLKNDLKFAGSYRAMTNAISGLDWEIVARDKKGRKEQTQAERVRTFIQETFASLPVEELVQHLADGEYAPMSFAEHVWDLRTKTLNGFNFVDGERQYWDASTSTLKVLTTRQPSFGERLAPNMWVVHRSHLFPGHPLEAGCWTGVLWQYCFKHFAIADWLEFGRVYGKPWRLAFIKDPKDRESVIKALRALGVNAAGAFPEGTEVRLEKGNSAGAIDVFTKLAERADDEVGVIFTGHTLVTNAKGDNGALAGASAQKVHEKIVRKGARGIMRTVWRDTIIPLVAFRFGYDVAMEYTSPETFKLKYEPPIDTKSRAETLGAVNRELLAPIGKAIDPQQIMEEFGIAELVDRAAPAVPPAKPNEDPTDDDKEKEEAEAATRRMAAAAGGTLLETVDDVEELASAVAQRTFARMGGVIETAIAEGETFEEMTAALYEAYDDVDTRPLAALTRDALVTANLVGRGDAIE